MVQVITEDEDVLDNKTKKNMKLVDEKDVMKEIRMLEMFQDTSRVINMLDYEIRTDVSLPLRNDILPAVIEYVMASPSGSLSVPVLLSLRLRIDDPEALSFQTPALIQIIGCVVRMALVAEFDEECGLAVLTRLQMGNTGAQSELWRTN